MACEASLPCVQKPTTCPYPKPNECSPCWLIVVKLHFNANLTSTPKFPSTFTQVPHPQIPVWVSVTAHAAWFYHCYSIWQRKTIMNLLMKEFFSASMACVLHVMWETTLYTHIKQQETFYYASESSSLLQLLYPNQDELGMANKQ